MKYYVALFQKIKDYYKTQSSNPNEIALICPSLRVYEDSEMKLLLPQMLIEDELKGEALLKKQDLSFQLNSLPSFDKYWDINPSNTLFDVYNQIINTNQEISIQDDDIETEQAKKVLYDAKGKPTKEKKAYDKYFNLFEKLILEWQDHISKYIELQTDNEKEIWLEKLNFILLKKEKLIVDHKLLGFKKVIEDALAKINKTDGFDIFLSNLNNSRYTLEGSKKTGIQSLESYLDINFVPYDFMSNNNGWIKLSIEKKELDELYEIAKVHKGDFAEEIISIDYEEKNIIGIDLEFSIITMQRSWFSLSSILSGFFKWNEAKSISDGETISNEFLLSAYPKKLLLIKNLKINIGPDVSSNDVSNINQLIYFGPIVLKNQLFTNQNTSVKFLKATTNKDIIKSDQLHYLMKKGIETKIVTNETKTATISNLNIDEPSKPVVAPATFSKPLTGNTVSLKSINRPILTSVAVNPRLFNVLPVTPVVNKANVFFTITDKLSNEGVYKCAISIKGSDNNHVFDIETDSNGLINFEIPFGSYSIECRADGYKLYKSNFRVENTNNLTLSHILERDEVVFKSFFLIGMICEKLPKIPK